MTEQPVAYALSMVLQEDGWKVFAAAGVPTGIPTPITIAQAEALGRAYGDVLPQQTPSPFEIVRAGTEKFRGGLRRKLEEAERTAQSIPALRKALSETENT